MSNTRDKKYTCEHCGKKIREGCYPEDHDFDCILWRDPVFGLKKHIPTTSPAQLKEETPAHQTGAKELVEKFMPHTDMGKSYEWRLKQAKQCALICVDEILKSHPELINNGKNLVHNLKHKYWQQVRNEINNL